MKQFRNYSSSVETHTEDFLLLHKIYTKLLLHDTAKSNSDNKNEWDVSTKSHQPQIGDLIDVSTSDIMISLDVPVASEHKIINYSFDNTPDTKLHNVRPESNSSSNEFIDLSDLDISSSNIIGFEDSETPGTKISNGCGLDNISNKDTRKKQFEHSVSSNKQKFKFQYCGSSFNNISSINQGSAGLNEIIDIDQIII